MFTAKPSRRIRPLFSVAAAALLSSVALCQAIAIGNVPTSSMEPTIHCPHTAVDGEHDCLGSTGTIYLIDKLSYSFASPHYGDIVVFHPTAHYLAVCEDSGDPDSYVKRIIGLPGDRLVLGGDGILRRNGRVVDEPYRRLWSPPQQSRFGKRLTARLTRAQRTGGLPFQATVPAGAVFVAGDFRDASCDSREVGAIPITSIVGKVTVLGQPPRLLCEVPLLDAICSRPAS